jgi:Tfp pilus assembly protein PilF
MARERRVSELLKRGYTDSELELIYGLARFQLETGNLRRAEAILVGITCVAPDYLPGWLGMVYVHCINRQFDAAQVAARQAIRIDPDSLESVLFLTATMIMTGDFNGAGSLLGEVNERLSGQSIQNPNINRFFRLLLVRYQARH